MRTDVRIGQTSVSILDRKPERRRDPATIVRRAEVLVGKDAKCREERPQPTLARSGRSIIRERSRAGLETALAPGRRVGEAR